MLRGRQPSFINRNHDVMHQQQGAPRGICRVACCSTPSPSLTTPSALPRLHAASPCASSPSHHTPSRMTSLANSNFNRGALHPQWGRTHTGQADRASLSTIPRSYGGGGGGGASGRSLVAQGPAPDPLQSSLESLSRAQTFVELCEWLEVEGRSALFGGPEVAYIVLQVGVQGGSGTCLCGTADGGNWPGL